jgi:hypothetical protein
MLEPLLRRNTYPRERTGALHAASLAHPRLDEVVRSRQPRRLLRLHIVLRLLHKILPARCCLGAARRWWAGL